MLKKIIFIIGIAVTFLYANENSFEKEIISFHPMVGIQNNFYNSNFSSFKGMVDCGLFKSGSGLGTNAFLFIEKPISKYFHPAIGIGINDKSGELEIASFFYSRSENDLNLTTVNTKTYLRPELTYFEFVPGMNYLIFDDFFTGKIRAFSGIKLAFANTTTFEHEEVIQSPENAVFINAGGMASKNRELGFGTIESANSILYGISLGIENMIPVSSNYLTQRISFDYMLNNITDDTEWKTYAIRLDIGFRFSMDKKKKISKPAPAPMPPTPKPDKPVIVEKVPDPKIDIQFNKEKTKFEILTGNEILATVPVVNSIFFEKNSFELNDNYKLDDSGIDYFSIDPVKAHNYILPRIAGILINNPDATVTLESAISSEEQSSGIDLAEKRGLHIKEKFIKLGVKNDIKIVTKMEPTFPSNEEYDEGIKENQRVDILITKAQLQEYVDIQKYSELSGIINFYAKVNNLNEPVTIENSLNNDKLIIDNSDEYYFDIKQRIDDNIEKIPIILTYKSEKIKNSNELILNKKNLEHKSIELNLDNFEAILRFNYNSSQLSDANKILLKQLSDKLPEGSNIEILGSADELGSAQRNKELEEQRAENTEKYIRSVSNNKFKIITGVNTKKFDESTPQGRFLNRSILIRVK